MMNKTMLYQVRRARELYLEQNFTFLCAALMDEIDVELVTELIDKLISDKGNWDDMVLFRPKSEWMYRIQYVELRAEWFNTLIHFYSQEH